MHLLFATDKGTKTEWALAHIVWHSIYNADLHALLSSHKYWCTILPAMACNNLWFKQPVGDLCDIFANNHNGRAIPFQEDIHSFPIVCPLCLKLWVLLDFGPVGVGLVNESMPTLGTSRESAWVDTKATQLLEIALPLLWQNLDTLCIPVLIVHLCKLPTAGLLNHIKKLKIWLQIALFYPPSFTNGSKI